MCFSPAPAPLRVPRHCCTPGWDETNQLDKCSKGKKTCEIRSWGSYLWSSWLVFFRQPVLKDVRQSDKMARVWDHVLFSFRLSRIFRVFRKARNTEGIVILVRTRGQFFKRIMQKQLCSSSHLSWSSHLSYWNPSKPKKLRIISIKAKIGLHQYQVVVESFI